MGNKRKADKKQPERIEKSESAQILDMTADTMERQGVTLKQLVNDLLTYYIDTDKTDSNYYQRVSKLLNGELKELTEEETKALTRWNHLENNKHLYGSTFYRLPNIPGKLSQLRTAINSGLYNRKAIKRIFTSLSTLNNLDANNIQENTK